MPGSNTNLFELDIPIIVRKGTRTCTQHCISKYLGSSHLSKSMQVFMKQLSNTEIPKISKQRGVIQIEKGTILEEMTALETNGTWKVVERPK